MDVKELVNGASKEGFMTGLADFYTATSDENKASHIEIFKKELEVCDKMIAQYLLIGFALSTTSSEEKLPSRTTICENYMYTIVNNFYTLKSLFVTGSHIQFQLLLRGQFEFVLTFICALLDDDFFKIYTKSSSELFPPTSSQINRMKCLKRILKINDPKEGEKKSELFRKTLADMYSDLSEIGHGNILRVIVQSFEKNLDGTLRPSFGGSKYPLGATLHAFQGMINYYQVIGSVLVALIDKKGLINDNNVAYTFLKENFNDALLFTPKTEE